MSYIPKTELDNRYVNVPGDEMTGSLAINSVNPQFQLKGTGSKSILWLTEDRIIYNYADGNLASADVAGGNPKPFHVGVASAVSHAIRKDYIDALKSGQIVSPGLFAYLTSDQAVANNTNVNLGPWTKRPSSHADFVLASDGIILPVTGVYVASVCITYPSNATGRRDAGIWNATAGFSCMMTRVPACNGDTTRVNCASTFAANANDKIQCVAQQTSGGSLTVPSGTTGYTFFSVTLIGKQ